MSERHRCNGPCQICDFLDREWAKGRVHTVTPQTAQMLNAVRVAVNKAVAK